SHREGLGTKAPAQPHQSCHYRYPYLRSFKNQLRASYSATPLLLSAVGWVEPYDTHRCYLLSQISTCRKARKATWRHWQANHSRSGGTWGLHAQLFHGSESTSSVSKCVSIRTRPKNRRRQHRTKFCCWVSR